MYYLFVKDAQLAQLVEQRTENPRVSGSIPELGINQEAAPETTISAVVSGIFICRIFTCFCAAKLPR